MMMKSAVISGKHRLVVRQSDVKKPDNDEVLIQVAYCGVCGTDVHLYEGDEGSAPLIPGTIPGHEFSGTVVEVGNHCHTLKPGDRVCVDPNYFCGHCSYCVTGKPHFCRNIRNVGVTVNGGFAEYCTVHMQQVHKIGDGVSFLEAAFAEPLACCIHGADLTGIQPGDTVMVIGGGTIGLIMVQLAGLYGATTIVLVEPIERKRQVGKNLGASICIDPYCENIPETLNKSGVGPIDAIIECVGNPKTIESSLKWVGKGGTVMMFGLTQPDAVIPVMPFEIFKREITLIASFINPFTMSRAVTMLNTKKVITEPLTGCIIPLDDLESVLKHPEQRKGGKVMVKLS